MTKTNLTGGAFPDVLVSLPPSPNATGSLTFTPLASANGSTLTLDDTLFNSPVTVSSVAPAITR